MDVVSLVDEIEGYSEVKLDEDPMSYNKGKILNAYKNGDKYAIVSEGKGGYKGNIVIICLVQDNIIKDIKNVKNKETEDKVAKIFNDNFLNQFIDKDISLYQEFTGGSKPSKDIDILYVTGATYSSKAVLNAINCAIFWYHSNID